MGVLRYARGGSYGSRCRLASWWRPEAFCRLIRDMPFAPDDYFARLELGYVIGNDRLYPIVRKK